MWIPALKLMFFNFGIQIEGDLTPGILHLLPASTGCLPLCRISYKMYLSIPDYNAVCIWNALMIVI